MLYTAEAVFVSHLKLKVEQDYLANNLKSIYWSLINSKHFSLHDTYSISVSKSNKILRLVHLMWCIIRSPFGSDKIGKFLAGLFYL